MASKEGIMLSGYFKVNETDANAMLIFPAAFVGGTTVVDLRQWLDQHGICDPIIYQPTRRITVVEITEIGASA